MPNRLVKAALIVATILVVTALGFDFLAPLLLNMFCDACPLIVRKSLEAVPGVSKASVSYKGKTAVVTYDDAKADVEVLTTGTTKAGYPSAPKT
jgi:mercuric ion binding protein